MLEEGLEKLRKDTLVAVAAAIYGCEVKDLLSWAERDDGSVVIIAPTGQKFTYSAEEIMKQIMEAADAVCADIGLVTGAPELGASDVTKEVVTPAVTAAVAGVTKAPARKKSTRKKSEPEQ